MSNAHLTFGRVSVLLLLACAQAALHAQDARPKTSLRIFERDPFDRITLQAASGGGSYDVRPLKFPDRRLPSEPDPDSRLTVELIDQDTPAEIAWRDIAKVELFEQMVLAKAEALVTGKRFPEAYDYFAFLHAHNPQTPRLAAATQNYLYRNAGTHFQQGEFHKAYALLDALHADDPQFTGLAAALAGVTDHIMQDLTNRQQYAAARRLLAYTTARAGEDDATASAWRVKLQQAAAQQVTTARQHLAAKQYRPARRASQQALDIWPTIEGAAELKGEMQRLYPMIIVSAPRHGALGFAPPSLNSTSARHQRLTDRPLATLESYTSGGPRHSSPWGELILASDRRYVDINVQTSESPSNVTAYDIASFVAASTRADSSAMERSTGIVESIDVDRVFSARLHFSRGHVSPLSLLAELSPTSIGDDLRWAGDYAQETSNTETRFIFRSADLPAEGRRLREIVEVPSVDPRADVDDLRRGRIDLLGRVPPWATAQLIADGEFEVRSYALPRVHLLLPNMRRPWPANRTLRRALAYAIDRERILQQDILAGSVSPGCQTISGPFPTSDDGDDSWGYAYDRTIDPLPHEPRMGLTLLRVAADEVARAAASANRPAPSFEAIVIGHENDWMHRQAATAIADQLNALGIACRTLPLEDNADLAECDFVYAELHMDEPVVDAIALLEHGELAGGGGYLALALRELAVATNWRQASQRLHKIHAAVHAEQTVIPLWQLSAHFAFRNELSGVPERPVTLYQDIHLWRMGQD